MKRVFDILFSFIGLILLFPFFIIISIIIMVESKGPVFFLQERVGINNKDFKIFKFRTMYVGSDKKGLLTVGDRDPRVTKVGYFLRKYKFDEIPQLINVFIGNMSFVGPRPEVRKYVNHYSENDLKILAIKPGITDYASIHFRNEAELLKSVKDPDLLYVKEILPEKIRLNKLYLNNPTIYQDFKIILNTIRVVFSK
ncbi:sugar transferase [Yeosuana sp. MJ-SS3]|uniref:Sugar transferase n=1 Tax=Gilvirhabdus luticola TaxID=3079858 RepID=A0ABU3U734_9FLAO|nr:sugar transferase [Yeosuana sp. MJ-SS3]MDU8886151.1 sugar transferase [Yeosuana sp. MJ-SS3]